MRLNEATYVFVLVEPEDDRNIGATARAMNTMGHSDLRLVRPRGDHLSGKAKALAHGSQHLLEHASVYTDLEQALQDIDLACATTARHRQQKYAYFSARDLPNHLHQMGDSLQRVAIVFGSEQSGLNRQDIDRCDLITNIPQHNLQPSLNLSQAVMIYAYLFSEAQTSVLIQDERLNQGQMAPLEYAQLRTSTQQLMARIGLSQRNIKYVLKALARLGYEDLYLIHTIRASMERRLNQLEKMRQTQD